MKKQIFSFIAVLSLGVVACNNDADTTATTDTMTTTTGTTTATGDYAAMADEFDRNSEAGKYMDVETGKPIKISVDKTTGKKMNAETKEPVTRYIYVDNSDWWVYDWEGNRLGRAKMQDNKMLYEDSANSNNWVGYDKVKWKMEDGETKMKTDDLKVKMDKDGDTKIVTDDKKIKKDEDGTKVKDN